MNALAVLIAAQMIAPMADQVHSLNGWENLTWGMTKAEALQAMPALTNYQEVSTSEYDHGSEAFGIRDLELANCHFGAKLVFGAQNGQLAGVILRPVATGGSSTETRLCRESALTLLRSSYGPQKKSDSQASGFDLTWDLGKTAVEFVGVNATSPEDSASNATSSGFLIIYHLLRPQTQPDN